MASLTWWTWIWASSRRWWRTGKPGVLQSMGSQRVGDDWATQQQQQHIGKSGVGPRSITTVWKLLWYDCPPVCGSPTQQLCGRANGRANIFQEDLRQHATLPRTAAACAVVPRAGHSGPGINTDVGPRGLRRAGGLGVSSPCNGQGTGMENTDLKGKCNTIHKSPVLGIWEITGKWGFKSLKDFSHKAMILPFLSSQLIFFT